MASSLLGKIALVTGGSGTIGQAIANKLALAGASVVLTGRNLQRLQSAAARIQNNLDAQQTDVALPRVDCISCDVTKESSVVDLFEKIQDTHKQTSVDILVNNAGTSVHGETMDISGDDFDWVMKVNVMGPFLCAREALKRMSQVDGGRIINIGSISAMSPRPHSAPYTASKFALNGLSQSLALDGREHNVSVGIIHPGNVKSELLTEDIIASRQHEGFLEPDEVADCVVTMASMPPHANVLEMTVIPTKQPLVGRG